MSVVFRDEAITDLDEIARYIAQHNPRLPPALSPAFTA
jgi:plasmid stabilization system protein ParE